MAEYKSNAGDGNPLKPTLMGSQSKEEVVGAQTASTIITNFRENLRRDPTPDELAEISAAVMNGVTDLGTILSTLTSGRSFLPQEHLPPVASGKASVIPTNVRLHIARATGDDISDTALHDLGLEIRTPDQVIGAADTRLISPIPTEKGDLRVVPPHQTRSRAFPPRK